MDTKKLVKKLSNLAQLDIDAVHAYEEALKNIDKSEIHKKISDFRDDHLRHINNLNDLIVKFGGIPPERTKDFKGYLIQGFTSLRSVTGTVGALNAMETNEVLTNKTYKNALEDEENMPLEVRSIIEENYLDEQRHLDYIRMTIKSLEEED